MASDSAKTDYTEIIAKKTDARSHTLYNSLKAEPKKGTKSRRNDFRHFQRAGEINLAMNVAKSRERFRWAFSYFTTLTIGSGIHWIGKKVFPLAMLLPMSAIGLWAMWEWDLGYGNKLERINGDAHKILATQKYKHFGKI